MSDSEQLLCLHTLMNFFSDPLLHFQCNLRCLHTGIFLIIHRFHIMDLHSYWLCGTSVKGCITVKQCHRNNRCFRPCGRLKGARLKRKGFIAIPAPRSLRKKQKVLSCFHPVGSFQNHLHGLFHITSIHRNIVKCLSDLL